MRPTFVSRRPKAKVVARDDENEEEEERTKVVKAPPKSTEQTQGLH